MSTEAPRTSEVVNGAVVASNVTTTTNHEAIIMSRISVTSRASHKMIAARAFGSRASRLSSIYHSTQPRESKVEVKENTQPKVLLPAGPSGEVLPNDGDVEEKKYPKDDQKQQMEKKVIVEDVPDEDDLYILTRSRGHADAWRPTAVTGRDADMSVMQKLKRGLLKWDAQRRRLLWYQFLLLLSTTVFNVYAKKQNITFANYSFFLNQFSTLVFVPTFGIVCLWKYFVTKQITKEMLRFPQFKFFMMGVWDSIAAFIGTIGGVYTTGSFQNLLGQSGMLFTLIVAYVYLKERYSKYQYLGVLIVCVGTLIAFVPQMQGDGSAGNIPLFNGLFVISQIPASISSCYKEKAFGEMELEGNYLQFWNAFWQLVVGFAIAPLNSLPFLGAVSIPLNQLFPTLIPGFKCMIGINSIVLPDCTPDGSDPTLPNCDVCDGALSSMVFGSIASIVQNVVLVSIIKYGGANVLNIVFTLTLPLTQAAFAIRAFNDPPDEFNVNQLVALFVLMGGMFLYGYQPAEEINEETDLTTPFQDPLVVSVSMDHVHPAQVYKYLTQSWEDIVPPSKQYEGGQEELREKFMGKSLLGSNEKPSEASLQKPLVEVGSKFSFYFKPHVKLHCTVTQASNGKTYRFIGSGLCGLIHVRYRCVLDGDSFEKTTQVFVETEYIPAWRWVDTHVLSRSEVQNWNETWLTGLKSLGAIEWAMTSNSKVYNQQEMQTLG